MIYVPIALARYMSWKATYPAAATPRSANFSATACSPRSPKRQFLNSSSSLHTAWNARTAQSRAITPTNAADNYHVRSSRTPNLPQRDLSKCQRRKQRVKGPRHNPKHKSGADSLSRRRHHFSERASIRHIAEYPAGRNNFSRWGGRSFLCSLRRLFSQNKPQKAAQD